MSIEKNYESMNIVIFSMNRAAQLDLFLKSLELFFPELNRNFIHIIYTYNKEEFGAGYVKSIYYHPHYHWVYERSGKFKEEVLGLISPNREATIFFVDDNVFKNPFNLDCPEIRDFDSRDDIICVSLRLCPRMSYCYTMNIDMPPPKFKDKLIWDWKSASPGDWSYPMSLDGHLFRTTDILPLLHRLDYSNPNTLEGALASNPINKSNMICFKESKIINIPANKVQNVNGNRHGGITAGYLNTQFLRNKRLSLYNIIKNPQVINNVACHQEIPLEME